MVDLITSGLSRTLMLADSSAKAAAQPMNLVSREMKKSNPNMELIARAGQYGSAELGKADKSLKEAQEELKKAQKLAKEEKKAEDEARLEEKKAENAAEKAEKAEKTESEKQVTSTQTVTDPTVSQTPENHAENPLPQTDLIEISPEAALQMPQHKPVVVDVPKVYTPTVAAVTMNAHTQPKVNTIA